VLIKLREIEKKAGYARFLRLGVDPSAMQWNPLAQRAFYDAASEVIEYLGYQDERKRGMRADPPNYRELGMERVAGEPTDEEREIYREVTKGGSLGEEGFVCHVLLADTDLLPDRYGQLSFRSLEGLRAKYLGRANDYNHSFDQLDAAGRVIDLAIGTDPGVALHPDRPTSALRALDVLNPWAGDYAALWATMAFPSGVKDPHDTIAKLKAGLVQDVSIAWSSLGAKCSVCLADMQRYCGMYECEEHGMVGGRTEDTDEAVVSIYGPVQDVRVFGHVSDGAVRRARYVLDPNV
jgi:hypothetical protein